MTAAVRQSSRGRATSSRTPDTHLSGPLVVPLRALRRDDIATGGGKAANLGELLSAGLRAPDGFCITTAAYAAVAAGAGLEDVVDEMQRTPASEAAALERLAEEARAALLAAPLPATVADAVTGAYREMGTDVTVAVRSSATAEDLPSASFAGQQETYLNVIGRAALLDAVRRCWVSLFTDRAVAYRAHNGIDQRSVQLAVAVQRLVDAVVAGVMFTANPITGRRRQAVIDASPGLGEAVVSGAVTPDHFVVDVDTGQIVERRLGDKRLRIEAVAGGGTRRVETGPADTTACLSDDQVRRLAALGARVERHYGAPQDTEWALDRDGTFWLVQARPVTTLYPLPEGRRPKDLRVYFSFNVAQGVYGPLTPMGLQAYRLIGSAVAGLWGIRITNPSAGPSAIVEAGHRMFLDVTVPLRSEVGRAIAPRVLGVMEVRTGGALDELLRNPALAPIPGTRWRFARAVVRFLVRTGIPGRIVRALVSPDAARERALRHLGAVLEVSVPEDASAAERLDAVERLIYERGPQVLLQLAPLLIAGLGTTFAAQRLLQDVASPEELDAVRRGLPHNPTTEMDLELSMLGERVRRDADAAAAVRGQPTDHLARDYASGALPVVLQTGVRRFLERYGHRGVAEIDLGVARWGDDPRPVFDALANYAAVADPDHAPEAQFRRVRAEAKSTASELVRRAARRGPLRGLLARFLLDRSRRLAGLRESPKFHVVLLLHRARRLLSPVGEELAAAGRLDASEDIFFLTLPEARAAVAGADVRPLVHERRAGYTREQGRRRIPRLLLSDGTEPGAREASAPAPLADGVLRGAPASAGTVTGRARVILDPRGARLEPGEILVAPSTDPGWTPLFMTAGGLVMEMGGPMSHGAIVAREYGIPAAVGVPGATERIRTGQIISVDGTRGVVTLQS